MAKKSMIAKARRPRGTPSESTTVASAVVGTRICPSLRLVPHLFS